MIKKIVSKLAESIGYNIINKQKFLEFKNFYALNSNFENLYENYENLFSEKFGHFPKNENRLPIMKTLLGTPPSEAYFIVLSLAQTKSVNGDVCEFGVAQGVTSKLIANEIFNDKKVLHLFDSFEGLPKPTEKDELKDDIFKLGSMDAYTGQMSVPEKQVINRLADLKFPKDRYVIHKGFIEKLIQDKEHFPGKVSFAYVDFDFYEPIKVTLDYLDSITESGAIIMVDDYDFFSTGVKAAVDEFMDENAAKYKLFVPEKTFGCFAVITKTM